MKDHYTSKDVQTIRLLHEYGFTDFEVADHLGLPPGVVRRIRGRLRLTARPPRESILADRRRARATDAIQGAQGQFGGLRGPAATAVLKLIDDRWFVPA